VVPQGVGVVDGEGPAEPFGGLGVAALGVGVAVLDAVEGPVPGREVDEADVGAGPAAFGERDPLGRVVAQRGPGAADGEVGAGVGVDRDGQLVFEGELVEPVVEVRGALDEDRCGPEPVDPLGDEAGAGGRVVPHALDVEALDHPGSRFRAW
jgi:hypothetical protein